MHIPRLLGIVFLLILVLAIAYLSMPVFSSQQAVIVELPQQTPLQTTFKTWEPKGLRFPRIFYYLTRLLRAGPDIKAGIYEISPNTTPLDLLKQLKKGDVLQKTVTLLEGWNRWDVMKALKQAPYLIFDLQAAIPATEEGTFKPDTYQYPAGSRASELLSRAKKAQMALLETLWKSRQKSLPYETPEQVLIIASMVEKESRREDERAIIADIIIKRWQANQRLQMDSTVVYALEPNFKPPLPKKALKTPSPYNTYLNKGLPPTPIANPSKASLVAAFNPKKTPYWYFVTKEDGSGGHCFSQNLSGHQACILERKKNRQQGSEQASTSR